MIDCIFCKIIKKEIPANIVFENDSIVVFDDISPLAPVHKLIVSKKHISTINDIKNEDCSLLSEMIIVAKELAIKFHISESGYRLVLNCNSEGGQEVFHIHIHLIGGKKLKTPIA